MTYESMLTLFKSERNRSTTPAEAGDNDYSTWTTQTSVSCDISDGDGSPTTFDHIFLKCSGVVSYTLTVDGVSQGMRLLPAAIQIPDAFPAIADVSITRDGWQHDLYKLSAALSGRQVQLTFTGTDVKINEVLILEKSVILNQNYTNIAHSKVDIDSVLHESEEGEESREIISGVDRLRWMSACTLEFLADDVNYEVFLDWIEDNPNCVVAQDEIYPWRVYKAAFPEMRHNAPYLCSVREAGNIVSFRLLENRLIGSEALERKRSFNDVDAEDKYLFFNDCVHLQNDRVTRASGQIDYDASDNNFETFSTATTLDFDISEGTDPTKVTHIFLKATDVTSYAVQTLVSNTWTTQQTVTPTQQTYRGWENSLEKLTTALTATAVRLVFTGSNVRISEIMLLEHAGGLVSMHKVLPIKVDRTGIVQQTQAGEITREASEESGVRFKWQLDFSAAFGYNNSHKLEDFLDWVNTNPNFVFAELPGDHPHRCYPAGFLNSGFNAQYITKTIQNGELVAVQLSER